MIKLAEQSNVPFVFTRTTVGTPALAITMRGEYPPLADMSMICVPSTIVAVGVAASPRFEAYPGETSRNAPPIKAVLTTRETAVVVFIVLEIEEWADDSGSGERVRAVYESQRDNNDTSRLKEDALPWLVCNIQRTEGEKGEHRECPDREDEHGERSLYKASRRERVELHRLREAAGEEEGPNADKKGREVVVVLTPLHNMLRETRGERK